MSLKVAGKKIIAVIPALNEEKTISDVLRNIKHHVDEIILVDDASLDKTADIATSLGVIVISNRKNMGYDKSIERGFKEALKKGADIIFTFDADGQHYPSDIPLILKPILNDEADLVVGKRPYHARFFEMLFAYISKKMTGIDDPLCGFKAYRIDVYKDIGYFDKISSIGTQLMFNAYRKGYRIKQQDISLSKRTDASRFGRRIKGNWKIFKAMLRVLRVNGVNV